MGTAASGTIYSIALTSSYVWLGGNFLTWNGNNNTNVVRLSTNGVQQIATSIINGVVYKMLALSNDDVLAGGSFTNTGSGNIPRLAKYTGTTGLIATSFNSTWSTGFTSDVVALAQQSNGLIVVGGYFNTFNGSTANGIAVLNLDGTANSTFNSGTGFSQAVTSLQSVSASTVFFATVSSATYQGTSFNYGGQLFTSTVATIAGETPPTSGLEGFMRYNADISAFQGYNGSSWELLERCTTPPTSLSTTGTIDIDFSGALLQTQGALTGNITYTGSNYAAGSSVTIRVVGGTSSQTLTFPSGWVFVGTAPTSLAAGKTAILTVTSFGTTAANVVAAWAVSA